jgi:hypothetical protein
MGHTRCRPSHGRPPGRTMPAGAMPVLPMCRPAFSTPTSHPCWGLVLAAVLTRGRRIRTTLRRTGREQAPGPMSSDHRVCSPRRWSARALARLLRPCRLDHVVPPGPGLLARDATVTEPPGPRMCGQGRQREGGRSPHRYTASRGGHPWGVGSGLGPWPCATRPWALPVLGALDRPPAWARVHGPRPQTPAPLARRRLARLVRWWPPPHGSWGGDSGDGTSATARWCRQHRPPLPVGSTFDGEAAL